MPISAYSSSPSSSSDQRIKYSIPKGIKTFDLLSIRVSSVYTHMLRGFVWLWERFDFDKCYGSKCAKKLRCAALKLLKIDMRTNPNITRTYAPPQNIYNLRTHVMGVSLCHILPYYTILTIIRKYGTVWHTTIQFVIENCRLIETMLCHSNMIIQ